jgi:hypothetical protein
MRMKRSGLERDEIKFEQISRTRHCEARSAEAIQSPVLWPLDCFASLAMTMYLAGALIQPQRIAL